MNNLPPILLAAGFWETVFFVVVFILWAVGQAMAAKKKPPVKPRQRQPRPQPQRQPQAAQPQAPRQQPKRMVGPMAAGGQPAPVPRGDRLREQVEEFLRRAGQQAEQLGPGPAAQREEPAAAPRKPKVKAAEQEVEILLDEGRATPAVPRLSGSRAEDRRRRPIAAPLTPLRHGSVAEHVAEHISSASRQIAEHTSHLGEEVALADDKVEARIHHKFDHELGSLGKLHSEREREQMQVHRNSPAAQIAAMMANPEGVQQAIVLSEILRRPEERSPL